MSGSLVAVGVALAVGLLALLVLLPRVLAWRNRRRYDVREVPGFLSPEECAHLIEAAEPRLRKSEMAESGARGRGAVRASATAFLDLASDPLVRGIKERIAELTGIPREHQEKIQVTHYDASERYDPHYDSLAGSGLDPGEGGDRSCTVILYLNDDYEGGSTWFPRIRRRIRPELGKALVFFNLSPDGERHELLSLHAGEAVRGGEKWISNQWIRRRPRPRPHQASRKARRSGGRRGR